MSPRSSVGQYLKVSRLNTSMSYSTHHKRINQISYDLLIKLYSIITPKQILVPDDQAKREGLLWL